MDITVNALKNATFTCSASAYPAPAISWYRMLGNGSLQLITDVTKYLTNLLGSGTMNSTSQLTVLDVRLSVTGQTFVCQATSGVTSATSSATLTVLSEFYCCSF